MTRMSYNYDHFRFGHYLSARDDHARAGDAAPDAGLLDPEGGTVRLSTLWSERPLVIEFGSITCPVFVHEIEAMDALAETWDGRARFVVVYVREAHPGDERPAHETMVEKTTAARVLVMREGLDRPVLVDDLDGTVNRAYGPMPNGVAVIGTDGVIAYRADWCEPHQVDRAVGRLVEAGGRAGEVEHVDVRDNFTTPSPGLLATATRVLTKAGSPALTDFLSELPKMLPFRAATAIREAREERREAKDREVLGPRFREALAYAAELHADHVRKGSGVPYVAHLLGVAGLVLEAEGDEREAIAALLHDALEDRHERTSVDAIARRFGDRVAAIVTGCTDVDLDDLEERGPETSEARKELAVEHLRACTDAGILRVAAADKLHNARTMARDLARDGPEVWDRFNVGREAQLVYYRGLVDALGEAFDRIPDPPPRWLVDELAEAVEAMAVVDGSPAAG